MNQLEPSDSKGVFSFVMKGLEVTLEFFRDAVEKEGLGFHIMLLVPVVKIRVQGLAGPGSSIQVSCKLGMILYDVEYLRAIS